MRYNHQLNKDMTEKHIKSKGWDDKPQRDATFYTLITQALAEDRERVMKLVIKDIQSAPHCNSSHSDLLSSLDTLTDK